MNRKFLNLIIVPIVLFGVVGIGYAQKPGSGPIGTPIFWRKIANYLIPSITKVGTTTTEFYGDGSNLTGISTGGNDNAIWSTSSTAIFPSTLTNDLGIGTSTPQYSIEILGTSTAGFFGVSQNNAGDLFAIDNSGYVGIGTTSPGSKLTVYTVAWNTAETPLVSIINLDANAVDGDALLVRGGANNASSDIFKVQDYAGNTDFVVVGNGRVGIGKAAPGTKLHITGDTWIEGGVFIGDDSNDLPSGSNPPDGDLWVVTDNLDSRFLLGESTSAGEWGGMKWIRSDNTLRIYTQAGGEDHLVLDDSGSIGIGTTTPQSLLSVGANNQFRIDSSGNIATDGTLNVIATSTFATGTFSQIEAENISVNELCLTADTCETSWPAGGTVGGLYGINVETMTGNATLTPDVDKMYQYLDEGGANRIITLTTTTASAGDRFIIRHNGFYVDTHYLQVKQGATELDKVYVSAIKEFIFDGTNWISGETGTGEDDSKRRNIAIGYNAVGYTDAVAIGYLTVGYDYGTAVGYNAAGYNRSVAIGYNAIGYNYGTAVGYFAEGQGLGVAVGYLAKAPTFAVAIGEQAGNITGTYKVSIGRQAGKSETTNYRLHIDVSDRADSLIYGEFDNRLVKINGDLVLPTGGAGATAADTIRLKALDLSDGDAGLHIVTEDDTDHIFASKVGIGTTTPAHLLSIYDTSATSTLYISSGAALPGAIILEDKSGGTCTLIKTQGGVVMGEVITCPTQ